MNRQQVIDYITQTFPPEATLPQILKALSHLQLEETPPYKREWQEEMADEMVIEDLVKGSHIPAVQLLAAPDNHRDRLIFRVLYSSGIRCGELIKLEFADIDYTEETLVANAPPHSHAFSFASINRPGGHCALSRSIPHATGRRRQGAGSANGRLGRLPV